MVGYGFMERGFAKLTSGPDAFASILHAMGIAQYWSRDAKEILDQFTVIHRNPEIDAEIDRILGSRELISSNRRSMRRRKRLWSQYPPGRVAKATIGPCSFARSGH
jgi:hypothetical protein